MTLPTSVALYNQGCRLNQAETATLEQQLITQGIQVVDMHAHPEVVIVNTCTVTENGDADTRRLVSKIVRDNPKCSIALIGCQAQILKDQLLKLPNVKWVVGNANKLTITDLIQQPVDQPQLVVPKIERQSFVVETAAIDLRHTRANLKVQDGCDFYCSFCVIPFARGPARSRVFEDAIRDAVHLVSAGHRELVLTGINVGTYADGSKRFPDLIDTLCRIDGLKRLRISSIEPTTVDWNIIELMAAENPLCQYLHLPIQSGTDDILERMSRKYSVAEYVSFVNRAVQLVPDIGLGTDVIVGFPGETDQLFNQTAELLDSLPFSYFHVFSYSERLYARSSKQTDKISPAEIHRRSKVLRDMSQRKKSAFMTRHIGREVLVLFESEKRGWWTGLTENYIRVSVRSTETLENQLLPVVLTQIEGDRMIGSVVKQ